MILYICIYFHFNAGSPMVGIYKIILAQSLTLLVTSCVSIDNNTLEEICDGLRGTYQCESIVWKGFPEEIDLDGDGECSNDIKTQMLSCSNAQIAINDPARVFPCNKYGAEEGRVTISIPSQQVTYHKDSDSYGVSPAGYMTYLNLAYGVLDNGSIVLSEHNELREPVTKEWGQVIEFYELKDKLDARIVSLGNGHLKIEMTNTYFDFSGGKIVRGLVVYTYKRVSYDVR